MSAKILSKKIPLLKKKKEVLHRLTHISEENFLKFLNLRKGTLYIM